MEEDNTTPKPVEDAASAPEEVDSKPQKARKEAREKPGDAWVQGEGPRRKGDTDAKGVVVVSGKPEAEEVKNLPRTPVPGGPSPLGGYSKEEITKTMEAAAFGVPGVSIKEIKASGAREFALGVFMGDDPRPQCVVTRENPRGTPGIFVHAYSFCGNAFMDRVVKPIMKAFGKSSHSPYNRNFQ